jgi:two-component system, LuxR family, sensor kinase FixL
LREKTVSIAADLTRVVERTLAILTPLDGYKLLAPAAKLDLHDSVALSAKVWFETLLSGEPPSAQDMDVFREISQRREHQRVPLQSLLQALRLGLGEIWSTYIALGELDERIGKELLVDVSLYLLDHFDLIAQIIVRAYLAEQYRQPRWAGLAIAIEEGARRSENVRHHFVALLEQCPQYLNGET